MPKVSVIVPNYRHAAFLPERLDSILAQTVSDLEVILLDDASDDGSVAIMQAYAARDPRVTHVVVNSSNSGVPFRQWRKGIELARGTWVWIAESDDVCVPDLLERLLALEAEHPALGLIYAQSQVVDEQGTFVRSMTTWTDDLRENPFKQDLVMEGLAFVQHYLKVKNVIPNASAVLFRRDLVTPGIWEGTTDMRLCGDWLFWSRLVAGTRIGFRSAELNRFRYHQGVSRRHTSMDQRRRRLREEGIVREELARHPQVDQHVELSALRNAWYALFPLSALFARELGQVRLPGMDAFTLRARFVLHKLFGRLRRAVRR